MDPRPTQTAGGQGDAVTTSDPEPSDAPQASDAPHAPDAPPAPSGAGEDASAPDAPPTPHLSLTDFLDLRTLQEMQDSFSAITRLGLTIRDASDRPLTSQADTRRRVESDRLLNQLITPEDVDAGRFTAPIVVEGQRLGSIEVEEPRGQDCATANLRPKLRALATELGVPNDRIEDLIRQAEQSCGPNRAASVQFIFLLANSIARLCYDEYHARRRADELSVLYRISTLLAGKSNPRQVLDAAAASVAETLRAKAVSIRLLDKEAGNLLVPRAVFNLSTQYMNKGSIRLDDSELFRQASRGEVVYVADMTTDPRVIYREDAEREGLRSMLCAALMHQGRFIGTLQVFSGEPRRFTEYEVSLLRAIGQMLATAIEHARLDAERTENQRIVRQLHLAADVQRRMLPGAMPRLEPFDIAARYVPSLELGGDFYDFLDLGGHLGVAVGDVVGKGVAAGLLMASVRASLRAYAQDLYDLDQIIARVNVALCRDTLDNEFATIWYGVLDPRTMRLTYCNAGHEPPLLVRNGNIHRLDTGGMIVGVDSKQHYDKGLWDLEPDDLLLLYTDGLTEALNFDQQRFGRHRIEHALLAAAEQRLDAQHTLNHVLWEMRRFTGLRRPVDDTTLVVVRVGDAAPRAKP